MSGERPAATEPVLDDRRPRRPCGLSDANAATAIRRSPGGTTSNSLRRPARTAVVGDRDYGRHVRRQPASRRQGGVEPVSAAKGDDPRAHSRPRSRCSTRTVR